VVAPFTVTIDLGQEEEPGDSPDGEHMPSIPGGKRLKAFPNPANDWLNLHLNGGEEILAYQLFNLAGQQVKSAENIEARRAAIPLADLDNGMYALRVITPSGTTSRMIEVGR
ncbi:MAG: T9SS type A sorting domain-containing protein, partial [Saprospiraceae bacterium]|nr:T9SS type A sorting domain-containing protein [Saprospiraceae bacterium]